MHPLLVTGNAAGRFTRKTSAKTRTGIHAKSGGGAVTLPIWFVTTQTLDSVLRGLNRPAQAFIADADFTARPGRFLLLPGPDGAATGALFGIEAASASVKDPFLPGKLAALLPAGTWHFANAPADARLATLAFLLEAYRFSRYRKTEAMKARLVVPEGVDGGDVTRIAEGVALARDLINTPSNDMGPAELEGAARKLARAHRARIRTVSGNTLAKQFPLIAAVGRASPRAPRLIDLTWGNPRHPKITLVGKGVCFDTGGLNIKPDNAMLNMKKDMGGAATVLGLAHMIMARRLKLRLRVLIPAVENAIAGDAFRPRDIYRSRKGITVEIGNTDAEGRLVLADALALAAEEKPALIVDMATLTGAARVALGPDLPPFYTDDDALADQIGRHAMAQNDPLWRLPLWQPYASMLDSKAADMNNVSSGGFAGSITAALFLRRFVDDPKAWLHVDIFAWTPSAKPGRPEGGECQAARALYDLLTVRYG
ncbi:MAG TPA: leucyl aminopeptidase family protein [Pseudolabrys sp.]|nr:leucyl aminopeptidase family protein [Pseudolabrys sp.]